LIAEGAGPSEGLAMALSPLVFGAAILGLMALGICAVWVARARPSAHRDWATDHARAPKFTPLADDIWEIRDVRTFQWTGPTSGTPQWEDRLYDLSELSRAWLVITPFSPKWRGLAHTFVTFEFSGPTTPHPFLALSVEARREVGERFGFLKGMLRRFELLYVAADEADVIELRALHRKDGVYIYPLELDPDTLRNLFLAYARAANALREAPAFYNTVTDNCTSRILDHLDAVRPHPIPRGFRTFFPGFLDAQLQGTGLIDPLCPLDVLRASGRMNEPAAKFQGSPDFSRSIRAQRTSGSR